METNEIKLSPSVDMKQQEICQIRIHSYKMY
jgi:hypothetical protein